MTNQPSPTADPDLAAAMARALDYTDDVGLSDGTDRPATSTDALGPIARPVRHTYGWDGNPGRPFYIVSCERCGIVLNSGHHYREVDGAPSPFAVEIADEHNRKAHTIDEELDDELARIEADAEARDLYREGTWVG